MTSLHRSVYTVDSGFEFEAGFEFMLYVFDSIFLMKKPVAEKSKFSQDLKFLLKAFRTYIVSNGQKGC